MSRLDKVYLYVIAACLSLMTLKGCSDATAQDLAPEVEAAISEVAEGAGVEEWVIERRVSRESDFLPGVVRYCVRWEPSPLKRSLWKCAEETDCRKDCTRPKVWKNRLDVGLFQLRDAPSWSWRRWFNEEFDDVRSPECLLDPACAADIAVEAILYLKGRARREPWKCKTPKVASIAWLAWWNGCGCYRDIWKIYQGRKTVDRGTQ